MLTAKVLLDKNPNPSDAEIRQGMATTLCRCMTYYSVQAAIKRAARSINSASNASESEVIA
jgi:aerobic-type carbon monoxide dehydrogenase small subunit (CoxS/CutS family)